MISLEFPQRLSINIRAGLPTKTVNNEYIQNYNGRAQWPRGLRHEMSSPAQTFRSWVRISVEAWVSVRVSSLFVLSCVGSGRATGLITRPKSPTNCL
jgi:hypothetical protein